MIDVSIEGIREVQFAELWPRSIKVGTAEAYCGDGLIITVSKCFTTEEDSVFQWAKAQDDSVLYAVQHLSDGRDLFVFERLFVSQTREEAREEHRAHLREWLSRIPTQHNTSDAPRT